MGRGVGERERERNSSRLADEGNPDLGLHLGT